MSTFHKKNMIKEKLCRKKKIESRYIYIICMYVTIRGSIAPNNGAR